MDGKPLKQMNWLLTGGAAAALAAVAGVWLLGRSSEDAAGFLPYLDESAVAEGRLVYQDFCASCHGGSLEGEPGWRDRDSEGYLPAPPHDETGHTWHHPDRQLIAVTALGSAALAGNGYKSRMAPFGELLSEREILQVLAYIKSTWPEDVIKRHNDINAAASG
jgi:mono/diheme cytochrome c family protein